MIHRWENKLYITKTEILIHSIILKIYIAPTQVTYSEFQPRLKKKRLQLVDYKIQLG